VPGISIVIRRQRIPVTVCPWCRIVWIGNYGWLYLAIVLDLFDREVVGWSIQPRMKTELVTDALRMA
jgi:transposase InsO family protein